MKTSNVTITYTEFERVDLRSVTLVEAQEFPKARKPAFKVWVDFDPQVGILETSAQITVHCTVENLMGETNS